MKKVKREVDGVEIVGRDDILELLYGSGILRGKSSKRKYKDVLDIICSFDIETSYISELEESIMYVWQFAIRSSHVYMGRTWEEFLLFISELVDICVERSCRIIIFVHNLSFEYQFIRSLLDFGEDVFIVKSRRILRAVYKDVIEFRCSYLLSNMSLSEFTSKMNVFHVKQSGEEYDYNKRRYPWDVLSATEISYCVNDVIGLNEAIEALMKTDNDTLLSLPLTSTGFVRRDARGAMRRAGDIASKMMPDYKQYCLLREAFRGGNTHANRYYVGNILENVYSADRSSSYPDVQINEQFPVTPFEYMGDEISVSTFDRYISHDKALLFRLKIYNIRLRDVLWGCPYISLDKCRNIEGYVNDNGRILKAEYLEISLTDIDYKIIVSEYIWDKIRICTCYCASYGKLPEALLDVTRTYYRNKTSLKGIQGKEVYYTKEKNKLNSIYGMSAEDPVKQRIIDRGMEYIEETRDARELLEESKERQFMPYQWGVWVTANARMQLEEGIRLAGYNFVYADTDCVKSLDEIDFSAYNRERIAKSKKHGATAVDPQGETHYMGVYETEEKADRFVTWGAKKYCIEKEGRLSVTVSGVSRKNSAAELERAGGLEKFCPGLVFRDAGGVQLKYADHAAESVELDGGRILLPSNVSILPSTYQLGITNIYEKLLLELANG